MGACDCETDSYLNVDEDALVKQAEPCQCSECKETIPPGVEHRRIRGYWTGEWAAARHQSNRSTHDTIRYCALCDRVRRDLIDNGYCITVGDLWDTVAEIEAEGERESEKAA